MIKREVNAMATIENFAAFGCPMPNLFNIVPMQWNKWNTNIFEIVFAKIRK
jgi:hypothetical protein